MQSPQQQDDARLCEVLPVVGRDGQDRVGQPPVAQRAAVAGQALQQERETRVVAMRQPLVQHRPDVVRHPARGARLDLVRLHEDRHVARYLGIVELLDAAAQDRGDRGEAIRIGAADVQVAEGRTDEAVRGAGPDDP